MRPVVTVAEMGEIDAEARREVPVEALIARAGAAVARHALLMMGGGYGRRVVVVAGKGHNGDDGRVAAGRLQRRGARVAVVDAAVAPPALPDGLDLVIDAAYGTGFRGRYRPPSTSAPVLAVDIPSGLQGDTGEGEAAAAVATVTLAALKPGLLFGRGPERAGRVLVADIGLDCSRARAHLLEDADVAALLPPRPRVTHKWRSAVAVVAGSPGMMGAPSLCCAGAQRAGAGMVRLGVPGGAPASLPAAEAVSTGLPAEGWAPAALEWSERCRALVVGPGLGRAPGTAAEVRELVARADIPAVIDADGLHALGAQAEAVLRTRRPPTVLTPHDGEFQVLTGSAPGPDRMGAARALARRTGAVVLLKGSTTVVTGPDGRVLISASGSSRLASAGTGDVLSGVIGAFLAQGLEAAEAAGLAAHVHGRAASIGPALGLAAGDLPGLVSEVLSALAGTPVPLGPAFR